MSKDSSSSYESTPLSEPSRISTQALHQDPLINIINENNLYHLAFASGINSDIPNSESVSFPRLFKQVQTMTTAQLLRVQSELILLCLINDNIDISTKEAHDRSLEKMFSELQERESQEPLGYFRMSTNPSESEENFYDDQTTPERESTPQANQEERRKESRRRYTSDRVKSLARSESITESQQEKMTKQDLIWDNTDLFFTPVTNVHKFSTVLTPTKPIQYPPTILTEPFGPHYSTKMAERKRKIFEEDPNKARLIMPPPPSNDVKPKGALSQAHARLVEACAFLSAEEIRELRERGGEVILTEKVNVSDKNDQIPKINPKNKKNQKTKSKNKKKSKNKQNSNKDDEENEDEDEDDDEYDNDEKDEDDDDDDDDDDGDDNFSVYEDEENDENYENDEYNKKYRNNRNSRNNRNNRNSNSDRSIRKRKNQGRDENDSANNSSNNSSRNNSDNDDAEDKSDVNRNIVEYENRRRRNTNEVGQNTDESTPKQNSNNNNNKFDFNIISDYLKSKNCNYGERRREKEREKEEKRRHGLFVNDHFGNLSVNATPDPTGLGVSEYGRLDFDDRLNIELQALSFTSPDMQMGYSDCPVSKGIEHTVARQDQLVAKSNEIKKEIWDMLFMNKEVFEEEISNKKDWDAALQRFLDNQSMKQQQQPQTSKKKKKVE